MNKPNQYALYVIAENPITETKNGMQLALHVQLWPGQDGQKETLCFYDTNRGHMFPGEMTECSDTEFTFHDPLNGDWKMRTVTIQEYRHRLAGSIQNGENIANFIHSTDDLWEYYRKEFPI